MQQSMVLYNQEKKVHQTQQIKKHKLQKGRYLL